MTGMKRKAEASNTACLDDGRPNQQKAKSRKYDEAILLLDSQDFLYLLNLILFDYYCSCNMNARLFSSFEKYSRRNVMSIKLYMAYFVTILLG